MDLRVLEEVTDRLDFFGVPIRSSLPDPKALSSLASATRSRSSYIWNAFIIFVYLLHSDANESLYVHGDHSKRINCVEFVQCVSQQCT